LRAHSGRARFRPDNDAVADAMADYISSLLTGEEELLIDAFCGAAFSRNDLRRNFSA